MRVANAKHKCLVTELVIEDARLRSEIVWERRPDFK